MKNKDAAFMIKEIDDAQKDLTAWEEDFMQSMRDWVDNGRDLTEKQAASLTKIHEKATEL